ncbi:MAG: YIP1 family protein [Phycisphaerales bacterium]|nr:YIP1 family protein [Phycisphaerales bacterium]
MLWSPRRAFAQVEDVPRYGWPLVILLVAVTLIGYATVQTGLIDRTVDQRVQQRITALDATQRDVVERSVLREQYDAVRKQGDFERVLLRIAAVVAEPAGLLVTILLIAAVLFGAVALTGRKAEWHTLLSIVVYASAIDVIGAIVRFALMLRYHTLDVDTSLKPLVAVLMAGGEPGRVEVAALSGLATVLDPFRLWFWVAVLIGLHVTRQLTGWRVWLWCGLCVGVGTLIRTVLTVAQASSGGM